MSCVISLHPAPNCVDSDYLLAIDCCIIFGKNRWSLRECAMTLLVSYLNDSQLERWDCDLH